MLKFISFGSGSSGNAYLLYTENDSIIIDCGVGIRSMKKYMHSYGLNLSMIHHILITHDHADHIKSVGSISDSFNIPVYSTQAVHEGIAKNWCVKKKVSPNQVRYVEKGKTQQIGDFTVTPFAVPHDSSDCVGYCVQCEGITFTLVTDCGHITEEICAFVAKANYLVIEANHEVEKLMAGPYPLYLKERITSQIGHLSNAECARTIVENATENLKHVWLCHLSDSGYKFNGKLWTTSWSRLYCRGVATENSKRNIRFKVTQRHFRTLLQRLLFCSALSNYLKQI